MDTTSSQPSRLTRYLDRERAKMLQTERNTALEALARASGQLARITRLLTDVRIRTTALHVEPVETTFLPLREAISDLGRALDDAEREIERANQRASAEAVTQ